MGFQQNINTGFLFKITKNFKIATAEPKHGTLPSEDHKQLHEPQAHEAGPGSIAQGMRLKQRQISVFQESAKRNDGETQRGGGGLLRA